MQNFKLDEKIGQEFSNFLQKFDIVLKDKIQNKGKQGVTLYDVSSTLYDLRESLTGIARGKPIFLMLLARTCLKQYGFSLQQVLLNKEVRLEFYDRGRLQIVLKLYNEMFLKVPLKNQDKQSHEIKISKNIKKEAIHRAEKEGPGLLTILGLNPNELNDEKKILNKKLKNLIMANHPDKFSHSEIDEKEKKEHDEKYKAANQMKEFLENGVLNVYLDEKRKHKDPNEELFKKDNKQFQEDRNNKVLPIENGNINFLNVEDLGGDELIKDKNDDIEYLKKAPKVFNRVIKDIPNPEVKEENTIVSNDHKTQKQLPQEAKAVKDLIALCDKYIAHLEKQKNRIENSFKIKLAIVRQMRICFNGDETDAEKIKNFEKLLTQNNRIALGVKRDPDWMGAAYLRCQQITNQINRFMVT